MRRGRSGAGAAGGPGLRPPRGPCPRRALVGYPVKAIVKGDSKIPAISAASILAKTSRDAEMLRLHQLYPRYGLDRHKRYPTAAHLAALERHGVCEIHRRSYAPIRKLLQG